MDDLAATAEAFVAMAHRIVWCSVATVDGQGRPRSRVMHPIWEWDGHLLVGWVGTSPSPKLAHLAHTPYLSCSYWEPTHDTCSAECRAQPVTDDATRARVWNLFAAAPEPLGFDPAAIGVPGWDTPPPTPPASSYCASSPGACEYTRCPSSPAADPRSRYVLSSGRNSGL